MSDRDPDVELVEFIAKSIVTSPDEVRVTNGDGNVLELETAKEDRGRVIGRQGRVAKAMRLILTTSRGGAERRLEIVD